MPPNSNTYSAEISAGSLLVKESREIARLFLAQADESAWYNALLAENVLQKKSPASARRMARLIRNRLEQMNPEHWRLVLDSDREVATHALLAAAVKHSRLLKDFIDQVVREHFRTFKRKLSLTDWREFLKECEVRDPTVGTWSETTRKKLGQVIFRMLAEAGVSRVYPDHEALSHPGPPEGQKVSAGPP